MYFAMVSDSPAGFIYGVVPYHWTQVVNIKRDPFEIRSGRNTSRSSGMGGALASPSTAYIYDWNMLPIGQALWLRELETYINFPPLQDPASYNLEQVMQQVKNMKTSQSRGRIIAKRMRAPSDGRPLYIRLLSARTSSLRFGEFHQLLDRHRDDIG